MAKIIPSAKPVVVNVVAGGDISSFRRSGQFYTSMNAGNNSGNKNTALELEVIPFIVPVTRSYDRIAVQVSAAVAATVLDLGIYNDNGSLYPGTLLLDAGTVSTAVLGVQSIVINQSLTPGLYWLAKASGASAATILAIAGIISVLGFDGGATNLLTNQIKAWSITGTDYTVGLPNPFPAGAVFDTNAGVVALRLV